MQKRSNVKTITLGCRFNYHETEKARALITDLGPDDEVVLINTCTVTHEAERQSKQAVRKAIRECPNARVIVTGCAVQTSREYFQKLDGIFKIVDNDKKNLKESYEAIPHSSNGEPLREKLFKDRIRAFIQIQHGCDHFCSYCIVPITRGRSRSVPVKEVLEQTGYFVRNGFKEIVISGIDVASYGKDIRSHVGSDNLTLARIIEAILHEYPEVARLRISSIDPACIDDNLFELVTSERRIMPHLHLSVQSGDNDVLRAMRRRHSREQIIEICNAILDKRSDVVLGCDLIVGFPTETDRMFQNTLTMVDEAHLSLLHVFPYSNRDGTLASKMPQLAYNVIAERAKILRQKADKVKQRLFESLISKQISGIVEKTALGTAFGKTDSFLPFKISSAPRLKPGDLVSRMSVARADPDCLYILSPDTPSLRDHYFIST
jgi:threonylcarbamoyladenosine tRNA methylthiotransferase MtaB